MKRPFLACVTALLFVILVPSANAQEKYPSRPVKIISPYAPGGAADIVARIIAEPLRKQVGQSFVIDYKAGANGIIANEELGRSKPDGYTLLMGNVTTQTIYPLLFPQKYTINYDRDVTIVARLFNVPAFIVLTTKDFAPKTFAEFIAHAKRNPGKVRYGHVGVGSFPHFDGEIFAKRAGIEMTAIPNKAGAAGVLKDLATGDTQMAFLNVASSAPLIKSGNIRPIALVADKRLADYPDVPTMEELGFKGVGTTAWQGLFAPGGTPKEILDTLNKAMREAIETPQSLEAFAKLYFNPVPNRSVEEARQWLKEEFDTWRKIAKEANIDLTE